MNNLPFATDPARLARARVCFVLVGLALPVVIAFVGVLLMLQWLPELPDPAATHWSGAGAPDGFGPAWTYPVLLAALGIGFPVILGGLVFASTRGGRWGGTIRFLGAFIPAIILFLTIALTWTVATQRGLDDAANAPDGGIGMLVGLAGGLVLLALGWWVQPAVEGTMQTTSAEASLLQLDSETRAVWVRSARMATSGIIVIVAATAVSVAAAVLAALSGSPAAWASAAVGVLLVVLTLTMLAFHVTVDASGLTARSMIGWPRWHVPVTDIAEVRIAQVSPLADYGGWGIRFGAGRRLAVVVRAGEAIEVQRRSGRVFVVTVDDAERGAALLQEFARRAD